jgi:hypothetical protein
VSRLDMTQPFFSSRKWIKLWINEWRDGTLRWQASDAQRAFWVDLLTLAGRSRYPGIVCAGRDAEDQDFVGYPVQFLSPNSSIKTEQEVREVLELFKSRDMLTYTTGVAANGETLFAITINSWKQYQSDYESNRKYQQKYRAKKREASSEATKGLTSQLGARKSLEVEVEKEREGEKETSNTVRDTFADFWAAYPKKVGKAPARKAWLRIVGANAHAAEIIAGIERWKLNSQWDDARYIPNPATFLNERRWEDEVPKDGTNRTGESKSQQRQSASIKAITRVLGNAEELAGSNRGALPPARGRD